MVSQSVTLLVTFVSPAKTAEPIEIPFGTVTQVGPKEPCVTWGADPPAEGANLGELWLVVSRQHHSNALA